MGGCASMFKELKGGGEAPELNPVTVYDVMAGEEEKKVVVCSEEVSEVELLEESRRRSLSCLFNESEQSSNALSETDEGMTKDTTVAPITEVEQKTEQLTTEEHPAEHSKLEATIIDETPVDSSSKGEEVQKEVVKEELTATAAEHSDEATSNNVPEGQTEQPTTEEHNAENAEVEVTVTDETPVDSSTKEEEEVYLDAMKERSAVREEIGDAEHVDEGPTKETTVPPTAEQEEKIEQSTMEEQEEKIEQSTTEEHPEEQCEPKAIEMDETPVDTSSKEGELKAYVEKEEPAATEKKIGDEKLPDSCKIEAN